MGNMNIINAEAAGKTTLKNTKTTKKAARKNAENGRISWGTRFAYGCGDAACNVVYGINSTLLTLFYTDYAGISAATIGLILLISRVFDGISDAIMGVIVEHTHSRWGKSRPWILWMSVPFVISAVLLFAVPRTNATVQAIYIFVTYNFVNTVCYTAVNLPYGSLSTMMTRVSSERDMLSVVRMGVSPFGRILAVTCTMPVVKLFGNDQAAWIKTMSIWAVVALILLLICFFKCEEKVVIEAKQREEKVPLKTTVKALVTNQYFWAVTILWVMQNGVYCLTGTVLPYYCKYVFHNDTWMYSTLYLTETLVIVAATFFSPVLLKKFGKRNMALAGACVAMIGQMIFCLQPKSYAFLVFSCVIRGIGLAPMNSIIFGFLGDVVEFGQWKTHVRQESMIFAGGSIGTKLGSGLNSAIITALLSLAGYVSTTTGAAAQPDSAIQMILYLYEFGPMILWIIIIVTLALYKLDKIYPRIMKELEEREAKGIL